jgi:hypothetical protein
MRYTVSPLLGTALVPAVNERIFSPAPVTKQWEEEFPIGDDAPAVPNPLRSGRSCPDDPGRRRGCGDVTESSTFR